MTEELDLFSAGIDLTQWNAAIAKILGDVDSLDAALQPLIATSGEVESALGIQATLSVDTSQVTDELQTLSDEEPVIPVGIDDAPIIAAQEEVKTLDTNIQGSAASVDTLNGALQGIEANIAAIGGAWLIFDNTISSGESILRTDAIFQHFVGTAADAARVEDELGQATLGLVDDQVAMAATSKLLSLRLVDNGDQAARIIGLGAQLGQVFLGSATEGINAFNLSLANTSPRGLQQLGISYDEVMKKQKEFEDQGESTRDAFRNAMLDVAQSVRDGLGDSIITAGSAWDRLKIKTDNWFDDFKERAAEGFEGIVGIATVYQEQLQQIAELAGVIITGGASAALSGLGGTPAAPPTDSLNSPSTTPQTLPYTFDPAAAREAASTALSTAEAANNLTALRTAYSQIQQLGTIPPLVSSDTARWADQVVADMQTYFDNLKLAKDQGGAVSEDDLHNAERLVAQGRDWARSIDQAAQRFENMKLSDFLGQQSGGVAGEISDQVLQFLRNEGENVDSLQTITDQMQLITGQQTVASEYMANTVVPELAGIAQNDGTAAGNIAEAIQEYMKNAALTGQQITEAGLMMAEAQAIVDNKQLAAAQNTGGGGQTIVIAPGMGQNDILAANPGLTREQLYAATGATSSTNIPAGTFTTPGGGGSGVAGMANILAGTETAIQTSAGTIQDVVTTAGNTVDRVATGAETDMTILNATGKDQLTGPNGLTAWWDKLEQKIQDVYAVISPLISQLATDITTVNQGAQNLSTTPPNTPPGGSGAPPGGQATGGQAFGTHFVNESGTELLTSDRRGYVINAANTHSLFAAVEAALSGGLQPQKAGNTYNTPINFYTQGEAQVDRDAAIVAQRLRGF